MSWRSGKSQQEDQVTDQQGKARVHLGTVKVPDNFATMTDDELRVLARSMVGTMREGMQAAKSPPKRQSARYGWDHVNEGSTTKQGDGTPRPGIVRDGTHYDLGIGRDRKGVFAHHDSRRSDSYPDADAIPTEVLTDLAADKKR